MIERSPTGGNVGPSCSQHFCSTRDERGALLFCLDREGETVGTTLALADAAKPIQWLPEGHDYTPPPPMVVGFTSWDMMKFLV